MLKANCTKVYIYVQIKNLERKREREEACYEIQWNFLLLLIE